jgi:hypothetical protein
MSIRAIQLGVRDRLRTALATVYAAETITAEAWARPPASAGQRHITVSFGGKRTVAETPEARDERYDVLVTVTHRLVYAPADRMGSEITQEGTDYLTDLADQLPGYLLNDWTLMNLVNTYIDGAGATTNGFCEPFLSASCGAVEEKPASWFSAGKAQRSGSPPNGLAFTVRLMGARRIRLLGTVA